MNKDSMRVGVLKHFFLTFLHFLSCDNIKINKEFFKMYLKCKNLFINFEMLHIFELGKFGI